MTNYYYLMWADAIQRFRHYHPDEKNWKIKNYFLITFCDTMYFAGIALWLRFFNLCNLFYDVKLTGLTKIDAFLSFAFSFSLPFIIINYILIFRKNRYEKIIEKYPLNLDKPKYAFRYAMTSIIFLLVSLGVFGIVKNRLNLI